MNTNRKPYTRLYPKTGKLNHKTGKTPIYLMIRLGKSKDGERIDLSTGKFIREEDWDRDLEQVIISKETRLEYKGINNAIEELRDDVLSACHKLEACGEQINSINLKELLKGDSKIKKGLIEVFDLFLEKVETQYRREDMSLATKKKYYTIRRHTSNFVSKQFQKEDVMIDQIALKHIKLFSEYLRESSPEKKGLNNNTTVKYIRHLHSVLLFALENRWIDNDPYIGFKGKVIQEKRVYLTSEELASVESRSFEAENLQLVRNVFLFCCYTGLAYTDAAQLTKSRIELGIDNQLYIIGHRQKSKTMYKIPLFDEALDIINLYADHPKCLAKGVVLPIYSNQPYNRYLKEIADLCGIEKHITSHVGRHTFAIRWLENGGSLESLMEVLGHKTIRASQVYGKIRPQRVAEEFALIKQNIERKKEKKEEKKAIKVAK